MENWRVIVVGVVFDESGRVLICRKPVTRGVFAGQWGLPGGGIEPGEHMEDALRREVREEVGLEVTAIQPAFFTDGCYPKRFPDGTQRDIYMIFLVFTCRAVSEAVRLNEEFETYAWTRASDLPDYDLNEQTRLTFMRLGLLPA